MNPRKYNFAQNDPFDKNDTYGYDLYYAGNNKQHNIYV